MIKRILPYIYYFTLLDVPNDKIRYTFSKISRSVTIACGSVLLSTRPTRLQLFQYSYKPVRLWLESTWIANHDFSWIFFVTSFPNINQTQFICLIECERKVNCFLQCVSEKLGDMQCCAHIGASHEVPEYSQPRHRCVCKLLDEKSVGYRFRMKNSSSNRECSIDTAVPFCVII